MEKDEIIKRLGALLTERLHIDPKRNPIHIEVEGDAIVMEGMVERIACKKRALLAAMSIEGTSGVVDRLKVKPAARMTDKEICDHLFKALSEEPTLDPSGVEIDVNDGAVDLEGKVPSLSHKRLCGVLAWWVPGSTDVINSLEVVPPEEDTPDEIRDALRIVLEKDRLVDAGSITIEVRDWTVTLRGTVRSIAERDAAEDDAWYLWGVNEVRNELEVSPSG